MTAPKLLLATALAGVLALPAFAQEQGAKNVILMVSDGIGFNGWLAADYYQGLAGQQSYQIARSDGTTPVVFGLDHHALNLIDAAGNVLPSAGDVSLAAGAVAQGYDPTTRWTRFENTMRNDLPPVGERYTSYTDSAAAGTALMAGRKTSNGRVNMDWTGKENFRTIADIAMDQGRAAGSVASVMVSHATPAAVIAHNTSRNNYVDIFNEMVASDLDVIMGAGHPLYDNSGNQIEPEDEEAYRFVGGSETLAALTSEEGLNGFAFIDAKADFEALAAGENLPERVVGIARAGSTLQASRDGLPEADTPSGMAYNPAVPDLPTMSPGALNVLNQNEDGFFLMIEGGAVDWMGHGNDMPRFIEEQIDFNLAVDAVIEWVEENSSWDETLLIVTSDHECGGIWGEGTWTNGVGGPVSADRSDAALEAARFNPTEDVFNEYLAVQNRGTGVMPGYQWSSRNHTNELVPLWAIGPGAELFADFTRTDLEAAELWGETYGWDGNFVDNTSVFTVMNEAFAANELAKATQ
ncbi:alkaline phosphatase [Bauldia sp.]|uniref:alkaline phosphatase n=1 Tax=Bauldia sp. TaxID=2575872 RepID=UPI003BAA09DE